jgi:hypothetical protein
MYHVIQILFICGNMEHGMLNNPLWTLQMLVYRSYVILAWGYP